MVDTSENKTVIRSMVIFSCPTSYYSQIEPKTLISSVLEPNDEIGNLHSTEPFGVINWEIHKTRKKIGKYNCTRATGNFRGRNYEVWFTDKIKLPFGP